MILHVDLGPVATMSNKSLSLSLSYKNVLQLREMWLGGLNNNMLTFVRSCEGLVEYVFKSLLQVLPFLQILLHG